MPTELTTEDKLEYQFFPVSNGSVNFKVRAGNDAHLALTSGPEESDPMIEVYIGGWKNSKSVIRKNRSKPDVAENDTPDVLDAGEFRGFWIRWADNVFTVGKDGEAAAFLSYEDPESFPIAYVGVCTGWGATGSWIIEGQPEFQTGDCLSYNFQAIRNGSLGIDFKGPSNCHVALCSTKGDTLPICELLLGGWNNMASVIRVNKEQPDKIRVETPNLCNPSAFTSLYIGWSNGNVCVRRNDARGPVIVEGSNLFTFPVAFIGVRTGWGATGQWRLNPINLSLASNTDEPAKDPEPSAPAAPAAGWVAPSGGGGAACWVASTAGEIPPGAVEAGEDGELLFAARAHHEGELIPGKLVASHGVCYVAWGGAEHSHDQYEVLCGSGSWVPGNSDTLKRATPAGETKDGEPLFIGRAMHDGTVTPGKVQESHNCCYIPYGGEELAFPEYEVFISN